MKLPKMSTVTPRNPEIQERKTEPHKFACPAIQPECAKSVLGLRLYLCSAQRSVLLYLRHLGPISRKVIACRVGRKIDRFLAIDTLRDAVRLRGISKGVMFHTDRGSQFTSSDFRKELDRLHMVQSFSAKGHPYDNAVMECFFKYLKKEELDRRHFKTIEQLKQSLLSYIAGFYNPIRPQSHNHGLSPDQRELQSIL